MAKRQGMWADLQRERARRQRLEQQLRRSREQALARENREREKARREAERQAAANERERRRLYVEQRKAEAEEKGVDLDTRVARLETLLADGIGGTRSFGFAAFKKAVEPPPFDPQGLDVPVDEPAWADVAPRPPGAVVGRLFGGNARYEREVAAAREEHERRRAQYTEAEERRRRRLAELRAEHARRVERAADETRRQNAEVDEFERAFRAGEQEAVAQYFTLVLDSAEYPDGFPHRFRVVYRPEPKELVIDYELPGQDVVPADRGYKYVQTRDAIEPLVRPLKEIKTRYASVIAQVALRTLHEVFAVDVPDIVAAVTFGGYVRTKDRATGRPIRPYLLSVAATREVFAGLVLADLDPVACVKQKLGALVSPHPYDLEAVRPMVDFEALLKQFAFVEGMDAVAGLDSRPDLLDLTPAEFEHLVRQLFEAMGMKSWVTQASKDDGVDGVATNEDPIFGGLCIIQAKRYRGAVGVDAVRELAGTMEDKHATKGIMVTTSWVTKGGHEHARRHGRMQVIENEELKFLLKEHLGLDVLISLPKRPPKRS
ncbi:restriction endonuclease [Actinomadura rugatobispora]|uniref:Restriction endonuclease n=1 Tax=Actinomadura rugatobispora TaxID=1994 RepID=A0ABW0ZMS6_9ACTN|nr:restriction endonuclease [Actinomadura rugatobispora]